MHRRTFSYQDRQILLEALVEYHEKIAATGIAPHTERLVVDLMNRIHESLDEDDKEPEDVDRFGT